MSAATVLLAFTPELKLVSSVVSEATTRQLRVLHIVSSGGVPESMQPFLFMPLLTRLPKQCVRAQAISLAAGCMQATVLRQLGVPVHEVPFSRRRLTLSGFVELTKVLGAFRPDVIHAWGHTAQLLSLPIRERCRWSPAVVWNLCETTPLPKNAAFFDRSKLRLVAKCATRADRIVYTSEAAAAQHRRVGFPEDGYNCISPGVDAVRFKPDPGARAQLRERLQVPADAFVIGMVAPFLPEYDHVTFLKGVGELIKTQPNLYVLLAGHGVQRGNAALMAAIGSGALSRRIQLLGEWSDLCALLNTCDVVCSSALNDSARMTLAMAMLCGVPCVATGLGAQGELIGQHGVAIEPGNPAAIVRGVQKILQMTPDRRLHLIKEARKHALQRYVYMRALQKYLQLYGELVGDDALAGAGTFVVPEVELHAPLVQPNVAASAPLSKAQVAASADPASSEHDVAPASASLQLQRDIQAHGSVEPEQESTSASPSDDVLELFELELAKPTSATPMNERARGIVEEDEELLPLEVLTAAAEEPKGVGVANRK
ncbi:MAG: glycosyltransferase [Gammaproteobacteria bacterium]|nr:hypothetical protein [Gammaproteobacteria bacterium]